ncbi:MAG: methionine--tRNA ligase [Thermoplasmata archaeon]|nr:methionine--tRNA ligase [Thermoplasmata archaeon]
MARIFIGVAWPYANGPFHIGHLAGAYLPADLFARYHRLKGDEVLMVSGSDMHGTPILVTAEKEGATPESVARRYDEVNRSAFHRLGCTYDVFTSTHTLIHQKTVQEMFLALLENGFVLRRTEENPFCPKHARFLPDRYLVGECPNCHFATARGDECDNCGRVLEVRQLIGPKCSLCGTPAEFRPSEHFFLQLDKLQPKIEEFLSDKAHWRANVLGTTKNFLAGGLRPTPITRDLDWGVPIPLEGYASKRFYVWFDAVVGYLSASREWAVRSGEPEAWRKFWDPGEPVAQYYFLGKDNIFFHTLVWPGMLLGHGGLHLPYDVPANEWFLIDGRKIAKSRPGDADAFIPSLLEHYAPDVIRFYAALLAPQNHDTVFDWDEFHQVTDDILANQYGNLVQRLLVLTRERYDGKVPAPPPGWDALTSEVGRRLTEAHRRIDAEYEAVHLKEALELALTEVREGNRRFHEGHPWQAEEADRLRIIYETLWLVHAASIWLSPVIPFSSEAVARMLGEAGTIAPGGWDDALNPPTPGTTLGEVRPLFPRREPTAVPVPSVAPPAAASPPAAVAPIPLDIRCAVVSQVVPHPNADKLYVLTLDAGELGTRTVVAGIRPFYRPEELQGRRIALLANLEPRTIRKMTSQGMVLAADSGERAVLLTPPESAAPGAPIAGPPPPHRTIRYEEFERSPMVVGRVTPGSEGEPIAVDVGGRSLKVTGSYPPGTSVVVRLSAAGAETGEIVAFDGGGLLAPDPALPPGTRVR